APTRLAETIRVAAKVLPKPANLIMWCVLLLFFRRKQTRAGRAGDDGKTRHVDEETVVEDTGYEIKAASQRICIRNKAKRCIENIVAAIRHVRTVAGLALHQITGKTKLRSHPFDGDARDRETEGIDLDRQLESTQRFEHLALV